MSRSAASNLLRTYGPAAILAVSAAFAYGSFADWPPGTHYDELKKVDFVRSGEQDFLHPLLMIQLGRIANAIAGHLEASRVLGLARSLSAAFGGLLVFATFVLGRLVLSPPVALAVAAAVAVSPLVAVHSTFFKEDIFLAAPLVFAVAALVWQTDRPSRKRSLLLGLAVGVAASAKYVGAIALPFAVVTVFVGARGSLRERLWMAALIVAAAAGTFAVVNAPLFTALAAFRSGFAFELDHAASGHDVRLPITVTLGLLHATRSLAPGLGWALLAIAFAGLAAPIVVHERRRPLGIVLAMALLWYAVHEISPLKPLPDFERYMVPLVPFVLVLGASVLESLAGRVSRRSAPLVATMIVALAAVPALGRSLRILDAARTDPRSVIPKLAPRLGPHAVFDRYSSFDHNAVEVAALDPTPRRGPPGLLVTSNFLFDRFLVFGRRGAQADTVGQALRYYEAMLAKPHLVISNGGPTYAFLNPALYIVATDGDIGRLHAIGAAIRSAEPRLSIGIGP